MKENSELKKEEGEVPVGHGTLRDMHEADRNLIENERFVKKLEIQIDIIKKIIDPEIRPAYVDLNDESALNQDI